MKIILYQPDIAGNLGAAMRLCACMDVELEVIGPCGFPLTTKALRRTAMDYGAPETLKRHKSWQSFTESPRRGRLILFSTKSEGKLNDFVFDQNDSLLFGRESAGAPEEVHEFADHRLIIPIATQARSFNLVTAATIALYEALRQTGQLPD